jgi:solute carrier family 50 protein (sugar transporter)
MLFLSCVLWLKYGILKQQPAVIYTNTYGLLVSVICVVNYYSLAPDKDEIEAKIHTTLFLALFLLFYLHWSFSQNTIYHLGLLASTQSVIQMATPFSTIPSILKFKSVEGYISLSASVISMAVSLFWLLLGMDLQDDFIRIPNALGVCFSFGQIILCLIYPPENKNFIPTI